MLIFVFLCYTCRENFTVYPINAFNIPETTNQNLSDITYNLNRILNKNTELEIDLSSFTEIPYYHIFDLDSILRDYLSDYVTNLFNNSEYSDSKIDLVRKLYNMKWRDIGKDRHYIFDVDLLNPTQFFSFKLTVYLVISDLSDFQIDKKLERVNIKFIGIIDSRGKEEIDITAYENDKISNYYRITNELYLLK